MRSNLLHPLNIIPQLSIKILRKHLHILPRLEILLPIQKPQGDLELPGILNNRHQFLDLVCRQLPGAFVHVHLGFFANDVGEAAADTLDVGEGVDYVAFAFYVGVEDTEDMLELRALHE